MKKTTKNLLISAISVILYVGIMYLIANHTSVSSEATILIGVLLFFVIITILVIGLDD